MQSMLLDFVEGRKYSIGSREGDGPGQDPAKWRTLFGAVKEPAMA